VILLSTLLLLVVVQEVEVMVVVEVQDSTYQEQLRLPQHHMRLLLVLEEQLLV
jgi:hypothetical protein